MRRILLPALILSAMSLLAACGNSPYSDSDSERKVRYVAYSTPPKTLDPAVSFYSDVAMLQSNTIGTLLEYHYAARPYELIPSLAASTPRKTNLDADWDLYEFELLPDLLYQNDDCFTLSKDRQGHARTRPVTTHDIEFQLKRIADPEVNSPVFEVLSSIEGLADFRKTLTALREEAEFSAQTISAQYAAAGSISGVNVPTEKNLTVKSSTSYPQIIYWFATSFTAAIPWEAVEYYDGEDGRSQFGDTLVGTGPYKLVEYNNQSRMIFQANPNWHGVRHPEWKASGTVFPTPTDPADPDYAMFDPNVFGRQLPFIERVEYRRESESIPFFTKFLQGYYDAAGVIKESFDQVISDGGGLSPQMAEDGISLSTAVGQDVFFLSFNMDDAVIGRAGKDQSRKLRQAMSMAIDYPELNRLFYNGRNLAAQSIIPPGLAGFDPDYKNTYREFNLDKATQLLNESGYKNGIDPSTGKPLKLIFATYDTSSQAALIYAFYTRAWRKLGLDVVVEATNFNQFRKKVDEGAYQIVLGGWVADYPDPENFFGIFISDNAQSNGGYSRSNFSNKQYDALYLEIKALPDGPERLAKLEKLKAMLEYERPIVELWHRQIYSLYHGWLSNLKSSTLSVSNMKYVDIDLDQRNAKRAEWNKPILWPLFAGLLLFVGLLIPAILTYLKERQ